MDSFGGGLLLGCCPTLVPGLRLAAGLGLAVVLAVSGCSSQKGPDSPGIELGAPGTSWAAKTLEQRFGYMAAQVHPMMTKVTPTLQELFNEGEGPPTKASCFSCHPMAE
jgi:hypothetical protein